MKYRAEVISVNSVICSKTIDGATHPIQAVRRILEHCRPTQSVFMIDIANESGERWAFSVRKNNGYNVRLMGKSTTVVSKDAVDAIFSGNVKIKDAGKYHGY